MIIFQILISHKVIARMMDVVIGPGGVYEPGDYEFCLFNPEWNQSRTGCTDPQAINYDINATISYDDNCTGEAGDCCEYILNNEIKEIPQTH